MGSPRLFLLRWTLQKIWAGNSVALSSGIVAEAPADYRTYSGLLLTCTTITRASLFSMVTSSGESVEGSDKAPKSQYDAYQYRKNKLLSRLVLIFFRAQSCLP
jgi:hypothetical protein